MRILFIVCEFGFNVRDKFNSKYSTREIDFYGHIPYEFQMKGIENHRLSLRKDIDDNVFEVYRFYHRKREVEVIFRGEFIDALDMANIERNKFWGYMGEIEMVVPCQHTFNMHDTFFCPFVKRGK